ncbi:MAG: AAA family ATPase, partial [Plesiomonas shigelloides]
ITLTMKNKTTIFVSENGTGKTTLLNAIRYIIDYDIESLSRLSFKTIHIKIRNLEEEIVITRSDIIHNNEKSKAKSILMSLLDRRDDDYFSESFIENVISRVRKFDINKETFRSLPVTRLVAKGTHADYDEIYIALNKIKKIFSYPSQIRLASDQLKDMDLLFLPTYRRVEKNIEQHEDKNIDLFSERASNRWVESREAKDKDKIYFGLQDVEDTLREITLDIERTSSIGYRTLSAKMLDDLISFSFNEFDYDQSNIPSLEDLDRFLRRIDSPSLPGNRLRKSRRAKESIDSPKFMTSLKQMYNNDSIKNNKYLYYFLSQLNTVIQDTKVQESKIEKFVEVCNKYLESSGDSKQLRFDSKDLEVIVSDNHTGTRISLNDLSSGEKQVISLMALIHLCEKGEKIILIDEPELSLSLKWQRMILPDLNASSNVSQIIAITHSPFIFDNELSSCATSMKVRKSSVKQESL